MQYKNYLHRCWPSKFVKKLFGQKNWITFLGVETTLLSGGNNLKIIK
jgi:hypothetical protein